MKNKGLLWRMLFIAVVSATAFFFIGYEKGVRDARDYMMEVIASEAK